jgi:hypothetical protein
VIPVAETDHEAVPKEEGDEKFVITATPVTEQLWDITNVSPPGLHGQRYVLHCHSQALNKTNLAPHFLNIKYSTG